MTGEKSEKLLLMPFSQIESTTLKEKLPMTQLSEEAQDINILPALKANTIISIWKLANARYTKIFHPKDAG